MCHLAQTRREVVDPDEFTGYALLCTHVVQTGRGRVMSCDTFNVMLSSECQTCLADDVAAQEQLQDQQPRHNCCGCVSINAIISHHIAFIMVIERQIPDLSHTLDCGKLAHTAGDHASKTAHGQLCIAC